MNSWTEARLEDALGRGWRRRLAARLGITPQAAHKHGKPIWPQHAVAELRQMITQQRQACDAAEKALNDLAG